jgi:hypothetical protein
MGRGRAKAKQTKVARELKYSAPGMDLTRLQQDLHSDEPVSRRPSERTKESEPDDVYARYTDDDEDSAAS